MRGGRNASPVGRLSHHSRNWAGRYANRAVYNGVPGTGKALGCLATGDRFFDPHAVPRGRNAREGFPSVFGRGVRKFAISIEFVVMTVAT